MHVHGASAHGAIPFISWQLNRPVDIVLRTAVKARRSGRTSLLCMSFAFFAFYCPPRRVGVIFSDKWHQFFIAIWHGAALGDAARAIYPVNELRH